MSEAIRPCAETRRALLKKAGRYATVTAPAVTLLLAASTKPAKAVPPSAFRRSGDPAQPGQTTTKEGRLKVSDEKLSQTESRRVLLKKAGRFATVTAPAVTMLLAASTKPTKAQVVSER